jgi:hypothetical protein
MGDTSRKRPATLSVVALHSHPGSIASRPRRGVT